MQITIQAWKVSLPDQRLHIACFNFVPKGLINAANRIDLPHHDHFLDLA
jgi:hypothetical protein